jgi:hypothetical protein
VSQNVSFLKILKIKSVHFLWALIVSLFWLPFCEENYKCLWQDGGRAKFAGNFCAFPFKKTFRMRPFLSISISTDSMFNLFFILLSDDLELVTKYNLHRLLLLFFQEQKRRTRFMCTGIVHFSSTWSLVKGKENVTKQVTHHLLWFSHCFT